MNTIRNFQGKFLESENEKWRCPLIRTILKQKNKLYEKKNLEAWIPWKAGEYNIQGFYIKPDNFIKIY